MFDITENNVLFFHHKHRIRHNHNHHHRRCRRHHHCRRLCVYIFKNVMTEITQSQLLHSLTPQPHLGGGGGGVATCISVSSRPFPSFDILLDHIAKSRIIARYGLKTGSQSSKNRSGQVRGHFWSTCHFSHSTGHFRSFGRSEWWRHG